MEEKIDQTKQETLWKIKDFEQLLDSRISEYKVNNMFETL